VVPSGFLHCKKIKAKDEEWLAAFLLCKVKRRPFLFLSLLSFSFQSWGFIMMLSGTYFQ
jgi:hypothetical protein